MKQIIEHLLNKTIKEYEKKLNLNQYSYDKCKITEFIIFLFDKVTNKYPVKKVVELIYTNHHEYNPHPYTYNGKFSKSKMIIHLLNQDDEYLLWLVKELINYGEVNE